jgi:hypothetical protein
MTIWYTLLIITMSGTPYMLPVPSGIGIYNARECTAARDALLKSSDGGIKAAICMPMPTASAKEAAELAIGTVPTLPPQPPQPRPDGYCGPAGCCGPANKKACLQ